MWNTEKSDLDHEFSTLVPAIREWLRNEPQLPDHFDDKVIMRFLHGCCGDLDRTKKCIEKFLTMRRGALYKIMVDRDPLSKEMQQAYSIAPLTFYKGENGKGFLIYKITDSDVKKFVFADVCKALLMQADYWIQNLDYYEKEAVVIMDCALVSLKMAMKVNLMLLKATITYLIEAVPLRLAEVNFVNCPPIVEKLYGIVKPVVPADIRKILNFFPSVNDLSRSVDQKLLPKDLGGEQEDIASQMSSWIEKMEKYRDFYLRDDIWKAIPKEKSKKNQKKEDSSNYQLGSNKNLSIIKID